MAKKRKHARQLTDAYAFPGFRLLRSVRGVFGDPKARIVRLVRRSKKHCAGAAESAPRLVRPTLRRVRDLPCGRYRIYLELEVRRVDCRRCGAVKRERLDFLADNPHYTKRFAYYVGRRCRNATIQEVAEELHLDWHTVKELDKQYMRAQLARAGTPGPQGDRHRRDLDPQGPHLPHRRQRSRSGAGRSGSAATTAPRPAWRSSMPGWARRRAAASGWR